MHQDQRRSAGRGETQVAKTLNRADTTIRVWAEVDAQLRKRDENIASLRAARLAKAAKPSSAAAAIVVATVGIQALRDPKNES